MKETPKTIGDVIRLYLTDLDLRVKSGSMAKVSQARAKYLLQSFVEANGETLLSEAGRFQLRTWLVSHPRWKSPHTIHDALGHVLTCFNWAADSEIIDRSPYRKLRDLNIIKRPRDAMSNAEYVALMRRAMTGKNKVGSRVLRRALFFLRRTGARTCEMRELRWEHIDFKEGFVQQSHHKTSHTTDNDRFFGLEPCVLRFLKNLRRQTPISQTRVFVNAEGRPWIKDTFSRHFRRWADRAGVAKKAKAYSLRHNFTCSAIEAGVGERQIADQLGHSSTRMVSWYGRQTRKRTAHLKRVASQALTRVRKGGAP